MVFDSIKQALKRSIFSIPAEDGPAGSVLGTDGSGNLNWVSPASSTTSYYHEVLSASQTTFTHTEDFAAIKYSIYLNGVLQRKDSSPNQYDYYVSGTQLIFRSPVYQYGVVRIDVHSIGSSNIYEYDFTSTEGQTVFSADRLLTGRMVQVYRNGSMQRINDINDYTINTSSVVFNEGLPAESWVHITLQE
jgi:hypothetical protein